MIPEIRSGIEDFLKDQGLDVREFGSKDLKDKTLNADKPAVNVIINRASGQKVTGSFTKTRYKYVLTVSLITVFQWVMSSSEGEARRREGVEKIIEAIGDSLVGQDFGLQLENPLLPLGFQNITTTEWAKAAYMVFEQNFWCSYVIEKLDPDAPLITKVLAEYFIKPQDANAQPPQAEDQIAGTL
jgi:hypothetical protein